MRLFRKRPYQFTLQVAFFTVLVVLAVFVSYHYNSSADNDKPKTTVQAQDTQSMISNASNVPVPGQFKFGLYIDSPNVNPEELQLGQKLNIVGWFVHWNDNMSSQKLSSTCNQGYVPEITWESWEGQSANMANDPYTLSAIASGQYDSLIKQQMDQIKSVCKDQTVIIRFDHEMDTPIGPASYYPWQGNPAEYVAAWEHVVGIGRSVDPNIKWLWSPNRGTETALLYYPGNQWVDYVGLTMNRGELEASITSFASFYQQSQTIIESFQKPIIISEATDQEGLAPVTKSLYVTGMFNYLQTNPKILALVWFNATSNYSFNSSASSLLSFQQGLAAIKGKD